MHRGAPVILGAERLVLLGILGGLAVFRANVDLGETSLMMSMIDGVPDAPLTELTDEVAAMRRAPRDVGWIFAAFGRSRFEVEPEKRAARAHHLEHFGAAEPGALHRVLRRLQDGTSVSTAVYDVDAPAPPEDRPRRICEQSTRHAQPYRKVHALEHVEFEAHLKGSGVQWAPDQEDEPQDASPCNTKRWRLTQTAAAVPLTLDASQVL